MWLWARPQRAHEKPQRECALWYMPSKNTDPWYCFLDVMIHHQRLDFALKGMYGHFCPQGGFSPSKNLWNLLHILGIYTSKLESTVPCLQLLYPALSTLVVDPCQNAWIWLSCAVTRPYIRPVVTGQVSQVLTWPLFWQCHTHNFRIVVYRKH